VLKRIEKLFLFVIQLEYLVLVIDFNSHFLLDNFEVISQFHDIVKLNFDFQFSKQELYCAKEGNIWHIQFLVCVDAKNLIDILHGGMIVCFATSNAFWSDEDWEDRI
jgi:hypothetical protein